MHSLVENVYPPKFFRILKGCALVLAVDIVPQPLFAVIKTAQTGSKTGFVWAS